MALTNYFQVNDGKPTIMVNINPLQPLLAGLVGQDCPALLVPTMCHNTTQLSEVANPADLPWPCDQFYGQLVYAVLYGITSAAYVLLTTLVLADLLGADKFTNSFGLLLLFQGVATFLGPPLVYLD